MFHHVDVIRSPLCNRQLPQISVSLVCPPVSSMLEINSQSRVQLKRAALLDFTRVLVHRQSLPHPLLITLVMIELFGTSIDLRLQAACRCILDPSIMIRIDWSHYD